MGRPVAGTPARPASPGARPPDARSPVRRGWVVAIVVAFGAATLAGPRPAQAQCASCGNPAFASGGGDMTASLRQGSTERLRLRTSLLYGLMSSDRYFQGSEDIGNLDSFDASIQIASLDVAADLWTGSGMSVLLPFGRLASDRNFAPHTVDSGLGDVELRLRQDVLRPLGLSSLAPRVLLSLGVALPTGVYVERQNVAQGPAIVDRSQRWEQSDDWENIDLTPQDDGTSRYLSVGRGTTWLLADLEVLGNAFAQRLGWYVGVNARSPLAPTADGFGWGRELRTSVGTTVAVLPGLAMVGVSGEWLWRGKATEVLYGERADFANSGGTFAYVTPSVGAQLGRFNATASYRVPIHRDVGGIQVVDNAGLWLAVGASLGLGAGPVVGEAAQRSREVAAAAAAAAASAAATPEGSRPRQADVEALLVPDKTTVVDYWASWCQPCQRLDVEMQAYLRDAPPDCAVRRFDASAWGKEEWARYLPDAPTLPVLEIYGRDGKLIRRLSGDEAFAFRTHLAAALAASPGAP